jgi:TetR/AcrR family transcriptional regulator, regulator of cefoperazone and chloramphenicol sensitivity
MSEQTTPTKKRILKSAGVIFGQKGFKDATIRRIAQAADVNIAAINYHFQGKKGLYGAVLEDVFHTGFTRFPATFETGAEADPEQRLRVFIRAMFYRLQSQEGWGGMAGQGRLIARELLDPSPAFVSILERYIKPHKDLLLSIIVDIMQTNPGPDKLMSCAVSIIGQCIYHAIGATVIRTIFPDSNAEMDNLDQLAESVWLFSLGGIAKTKEDFLSSRKAEL